MTDLDTALRAADFHVPDAAKVIREHLEALRRERDLLESHLADAMTVIHEADKLAEQAAKCELQSMHDGLVIVGLDEDAWGKLEDMQWTNVLVIPMEPKND
jgi:hypothetical protein